MSKIKNQAVKVGIFWVLPDKKIYVKDETVIAEKAVTDSRFAHFTEWDKISRLYPFADFATYPRGRVVFDTLKDCHIIYADKCISASSLKIIARRFANNNKYTVAYDEHYACDKCTPKNLFE